MRNDLYHNDWPKKGNDPPKQKIAKIIAELKGKNVILMIITGDNTLIAKYIAKQIGISYERII